MAVPARLLRTWPLTSNTNLGPSRGHPPRLGRLTSSANLETALAGGLGLRPSTLTQSTTFGSPWSRAPPSRPASAAPRPSSLPATPPTPSTGPCLSTQERHSQSLRVSKREQVIPSSLNLKLASSKTFFSIRTYKTERPLNQLKLRCSLAALYSDK